MLSEEKCEPSGRYLFADQLLTDESIAIWQSECKKRCKDNKKDEAYEKYVNWKRKENEAAVYTLYAYADFDIPKSFNVIFNANNPDNFLKINYQLTQSIYEGWFPINSIEHGHKHLCVFSFDSALPDILNVLNKGNEKFSTAPKEHDGLGFCNSNDFDAITTRPEKVFELRKQ